MTPRAFCKRLSIVAVLFVVLIIGGCAGMNSTQQRTLSGAAIGAGGGALIGGIAGGSPGIGAALGAGAGAVGGYLYDQSQRRY
jgi:osmotically inducible lipoprotein OsmB